MRIDEGTYKGMPARLQALFDKLPNPGSDEVTALFPVNASGPRKPSRRTSGDSMFRMPGGTRGAVTDSGSAARFFKACPFTEEELCSANIAGLNSNPPRKPGGSAPSDAATWGSQEGSATQTELSPATLGCTGSCNECTQRQNLVPPVDGQENTDTIPITTSHLRSSGSVNPATTKSIPATGRTEPSRFMYCPKASRAERNAGCEAMEEKRGGGMQGTNDQTLLTGSGNQRNPFMQNHHPTVKPLALMRYLAKLTATPTGGIVLDPFMGSGTTGMAAVYEGRDFIGIELEPEYFEIATARINYALDETGQPEQLSMGGTQ